MRSFAIVAGLAASANAYAYGYPAYNETSSAAPAYPAASTPAGYPEASSAAGYSAYPVSSKAAEYPAYTTTTTVKGLTTVCSEATSFSVGTKTYVVTKPTTIIDEDCEYTTAVVVKPTPSAAKPIVSVPAPGKPSMVAPGMPTPLLPVPPPAPSPLLPSSLALLPRLVLACSPSSVPSLLSCKRLASVIWQRRLRCALRGPGWTRGGMGSHG
jgi:hypothetical protein